MATILPANSTFVGSLSNADAIFEGVNGSVVGVSFFVGNTPQHTGVFGAPGSGKSVHLVDCLSQIADDLEFLLIMEEGEGFSMLVELLGGETLIVHPDRNEVFNVFDTQGLPLMSSQIQIVSEFLRLCIGDLGVSVEAKEVSALVNRYVKRIYEDTIEDWIRRHGGELDRVMRESYALHRLGKERDHLGDYTEAYVEFRDWERDDPRAVS